MTNIQTQQMINQIVEAFTTVMFLGMITLMVRSVIKSSFSSGNPHQLKGTEYTAPPYELELDPGRGVLYLHDLMTGETKVRICRIPEEVWEDYMSGRGSLSISITHTRPKTTKHELCKPEWWRKRFKKSPVFLNIDPAHTGFAIVDEAGAILVEVLSVPEYLVRTLEKGEFIDITLGFTGRGVEITSSDVSGKAPTWAEELVHLATEWWEEQTKRVSPKPELHWVVSEYKLKPEGHAYIDQNILTLVVPKDEDLADTKLTLLHELVHIILRDPSHSDDFWNLAVRLYSWAEFSDSEMLKLEERRFSEDLEQALERLGTTEHKNPHSSSSVKVGFTGTQAGMTQAQTSSFEHLVTSLDSVVEFHHGDCKGSDEQAHDIIRRLLPDTVIHIHPPENPKLRAFKLGVMHEPKGYIGRNWNIVDASDVLIATPRLSREELRSGTWATIRYAKKKGKKVFIIWPEGEVTPRGSNPEVPEVKEHSITDSRGIPHTFIVKWRDRLAMFFYYLDSKQVGVDDRLGWAYTPEGKQVKDKILRDKMDSIVFSKVIPTGANEEGE